MLSVNGKPLLLKDPSMKEDQHVKFVNDCIALVKQKSGGVITLDLASRHKAMVQAESTGFVVPNVKERGKKKIILEETVLKDGMNETWRYYTNVKDFGQGLKKYHPKHFMVDDTMNFSGASADMELMFFLVFISPVCAKVPTLAHLQNPNQKNKPASICLMLPEEEAALAVELGRKRAQISHKIYSELSFDDLKKLAKGTFNISGTDTMRENMLREALVIKATANNESMEKFARDSNINPYVSLLSDVNEAVEKNLIRKTNQFGRKRWCYIKEDGKLGDDIVAIAKGGTDDEELEFLYDFYKTHPADYEFIQNKLRPAVKTKKSEVDD